MGAGGLLAATLKIISKVIEETKAAVTGSASAHFERTEAYTITKQMVEVVLRRAVEQQLKLPAGKATRQALQEHTKFWKHIMSEQSGIVGDTGEIVAQLAAGYHEQLAGVLGDAGAAVCFPVIIVCMALYFCIEYYFELFCILHRMTM